MNVGTKELEEVGVPFLPPLNVSLTNLGLIDSMTPDFLAAEALCEVWGPHYHHTEELRG